MVNSTTPTPSLNSASPEISVSSSCGTLTCLSRLSTATGSVGLMSAPNTSAQASGRFTPSSRPRPHKPKPTTTVEITTPNSRHRRHRHEALAQPRPVHVQRAGEQQEGEHAVHHRLVEIDLAQEVGEIVDHGDAGDQEIDDEHDQRRGDAHQQQPDIGGQMEEHLVEPAERGRQQQQHGEEVEE